MVQLKRLSGAIANDVSLPISIRYLLLSLGHAFWVLILSAFALLTVIPGGAQISDQRHKHAAITM